MLYPLTPGRFDGALAPERSYLVAQVVPLATAEIGEPVHTGLFTAIVCRLLNTTASDAVSRILLRLAPTSPHATHDGESFMRFKRECTGWRWHPSTAAPVLLPDLEPGGDIPDVHDTRSAFPNPHGLPTDSMGLVYCMGGCKRRLTPTRVDALGMCGECAGVPDDGSA